MLIRLIEFSTFFAASIAAAIFYFSPQTNPRWRPALKYIMYALVLVVVLSEFLLKDLTGKGWEDRAAHLAGYAFCAVIPQFSPCYDRTIADLNEAIRENPHSAATLVARGNAYFGHGDFDRAIEDFDEAVRINPEFAAAYAGRAYAYRAKGKEDRAVSDIQQASKLDSQFASAASSIVHARAAPAIEEETARRKIEPEIALMMRSGADLMANGDIASARQLYQRAAEAGDAMAALALAETYDPLVLRRVNPKGGITPDVALAQIWYQKAKNPGSAVAPERLERLARLPAIATPVSVSPPATPSSR